MFFWNTVYSRSTVSFWWFNNITYYIRRPAAWWHLCFLGACQLLGRPQRSRSLEALWSAAVLFCHHSPGLQSARPSRGPRQKCDTKDWLGHFVHYSRYFTANEKCTIWPRFWTQVAIEFPVFQNGEHSGNLKHCLWAPMMDCRRHKFAIGYSWIHSTARAI